MLSTPNITLVKNWNTLQKDAYSSKYWEKRVMGDGKISYLPLTMLKKDKSLHDLGLQKDHIGLQWLHQNPHLYDTLTATEDVFEFLLPPFSRQNYQDGGHAYYFVITWFCWRGFDSIQKYMMIEMMTTMLLWNSNDVFGLLRNLQSYYHLYFQIFLQKCLMIFNRLENILGGSSKTCDDKTGSAFLEIPRRYLWYLFWNPNNSYPYNVFIFRFQNQFFHN